MDTIGDLYICPKKDIPTLDAFAREFFRWLHIGDFEVVDDLARFFRARAGGIQFDVWRNGTGGVLEAFPYVIRMNPEGTSQAADYLIEHARILAWRLSHQGFRCFVPRSPGIVTSTKEGTLYDA